MTCPHGCGPECDGWSGAYEATEGTNTTMLPRSSTVDATGAAWVSPDAVLVLCLDDPWPLEGWRRRSLPTDDEGAARA